MAIEVTGPTMSRWAVQGPLGIHVHWMIQVTEERADELLRYQTVALPAMRTYWELSFTAGANSNETKIRELMKVPLGTFGQAALGLLGKPPAAEVAANLQRLKELMEPER